MEQLLKGKVALVTGSTSGLGKAVAIEFAKKGANVVVSGRREQEGHQTVLEIEAINLGKAFFCRCDVSILEDVQNLIQFTIAKFGFLHFAVNNAAIGGQTKK